jgi:prefoldin subunit 5
VIALLFSSSCSHVECRRWSLTDHVLTDANVRLTPAEEFRIHFLEVENRYLETTNASRRAQINGLQTENQQLEARVDQLEVTTADLDATMQDLNASNHGLQATVDGLDQRVSSAVVGDGSAMLGVSSESSSSVPVSPHVELMLQQMADRIAQLEAANHQLTATVAGLEAITQDLKAENSELKTAAITRCTFPACTESATDWCVDCAELCSAHALSVHTGSWSGHVHMRIEQKSAFHREKKQAMWTQKATEVKSTMDHIANEANQLKSKLTDPATLAKHEAELKGQFVC